MQEIDCKQLLESAAHGAVKMAIADTDKQTNRHTETDTQTYVRTHRHIYGHKDTHAQTYCGLRWVCKFVFRVLQTTSNE